MTRVLVIHHDIDLSDQEVDSLRRRGYDARQCLGPIGSSCPVLNGLPCTLAEEADVLVYDAFVTGEPDGAQSLIEGMRELHPDVPIVLVASGMEPSWMETAGQHGVTPLVGQPTGERLVEAVEAAIAAKDGDSEAGSADDATARAGDAAPGD
jgi:DNA-binding NarL/FixJ family response regulator